VRTLRGIVSSAVIASTSQFAERVYADLVAGVQKRGTH
jgi:hypothetical protein